MTILVTNGEFFIGDNRTSSSKKAGMFCAGCGEEHGAYHDATIKLSLCNSDPEKRRKHHTFENVPVIAWAVAGNSKLKDFISAILAGTDLKEYLQTYFKTLHIGNKYSDLPTGSVLMILKNHKIVKMLISVDRYLVEYFDVGEVVIAGTGGSMYNAYSKLFDLPPIELYQLACLHDEKSSHETYDRISVEWDGDQFKGATFEGKQAFELTEKALMKKVKKSFR